MKEYKTNVLTYTDIIHESYKNGYTTTDVSNKINALYNRLNNFELNQTLFDYYNNLYGIKPNDSIYVAGIKVGSGLHKFNGYLDKFAFIVESNELFNGVSLSLTIGNTVYDIGSTYSEKMIEDDLVLLYEIKPYDMLPDKALIDSSNDVRINNKPLSEVLFVQSFTLTSYISGDVITLFNEDISTNDVKCYDLSSYDNIAIVGSSKYLNAVKDKSYFTTDNNNVLIVSEQNLSNSDKEALNIVGLNNEIQHIDPYIPISRTVEDEIVLMKFLSGFFNGLYHKTLYINDVNSDIYWSKHISYEKAFNRNFMSFKIGLYDGINNVYNGAYINVAKNKYTDQYVSNIDTNSIYSLTALSLYDKIIKNIRVESVAKNVNNGLLSLTNSVIVSSDFDEILSYYGLDDIYSKNMIYDLMGHDSNDSITLHLIHKEILSVTRLINNDQFVSVLSSLVNLNENVNKVYSVLLEISDKLIGFKYNIDKLLKVLINYLLLSIKPTNYYELELINNMEKDTIEVDGSLHRGYLNLIDSIKHTDNINKNFVYNVIMDCLNNIDNKLIECDGDIENESMWEVKNKMKDIAVKYLDQDSVNKILTNVRG